MRYAIEEKYILSLLKSSTMKGFLKGILNLLELYSQRDI